MILRALIFYGFAFAIIFNSSKIKRNIFYFNQPWYFFFFDTDTAAAIDAVAAIAATVDAAVAAAVAALVMMYLGRSISIILFCSI